ncbi:TIGR02679 family protein [Dehalobacterium formicoaceticum]|uniref:TIGR02679 family protein n=1 Tax=Dehalobacterium formicoaceticum TaxID=51515 RepID=A0ABT1Y5X9_9FIRM|nr:TIGR02679 family protein [Dehalobacterium formicoaceticum]MCR6545096.1 TIGR02679 family protein [Dehalobacterium formicoaceticum]
MRRERRLLVPEIPSKTRQAAAFFKGEKGFRRLFPLFAEKYRGLGRIGGSVRLTNLTREEKEALSMLLSKDYKHQVSAEISLETFEQSLNKTRYAGIKLKDLLDAYFEEDILTKAEAYQQYQEQKEDFFKDLEQKYDHQNCRGWLAHIQEKGAGTRGIHQAYDKSPSTLKNQLKNILSALSRLPQDGFLRLPIFANSICQDPHGFDLGTEQGRFFISALQFLRNQADDTYPINSSPSTEEKNEVMEYFGLLRDDILNFVTSTGIVAFDEQDEIMPIWQWAARQGIVLNVPIREIVKVNRFVPMSFDQGQECPHRVFVLENSGVFSAVLDHFSAGSRPAMICTHGQFKLAALLMMDRLAASDILIYYSGDFDPEGLQMAQQLLRRYPGKVRLWHFGAEDYAASLSAVSISETRLKKLNSVMTEELQSVKEKMLWAGKAGYQEELIPILVEDMKEYIKNCPSFSK